MSTPGDSEPEPSHASRVERIRLTAGPARQALILLLIVGVGFLLLTSWVWMTKQSDGARAVAALWATAITGLVPLFLLGRLTMRRVRADSQARRGTHGWAFVALGVAPVIGIVLARSLAPADDASNVLIVGIGGVLCLWLSSYLVGFRTGARPDGE